MYYVDTITTRRYSRTTTSMYRQVLLGRYSKGTTEHIVGNGQLVNQQLLFSNYLDVCAIASSARHSGCNVRVVQYCMGICYIRTCMQMYLNGTSRSTYRIRRVVVRPHLVTNFNSLVSQETIRICTYIIIQCACYAVCTTSYLHLCNYVPSYTYYVVHTTYICTYRDKYLPMYGQMYSYVPMYVRIV